MKSIVSILEKRISSAMKTASGADDCVALVRPAVDPKFGDYQANGVMALAKQLKTNPRKLAEDIVKNLKIDDICLEPEVAGPGFINLRLNPDYVCKALLEVNTDSQNRL
ncbi:MAG: arginine--tRNA ligase, partial [Planctomycetota bacterium]